MLIHAWINPAHCEKKTLERPICRFLIIACSYVVFAQIGQHLAITDHFISLVWAPTGISVAMLTIWGLRYWPAVLLGAFITPLSVGIDPLTALWMASGGCAAPALGAYGLRTSSFFDNAFTRRTSVFYFMLVAGFAAMLISSTNGVAALYVGGYLDAEGLLTAWMTYWIGDTIGVLVVAPVILTATHGRWYTWRQDCSATEFFGIAACFVLLTCFAFANPLGFTVTPTVVYLPFPLLLWVSLRGGAFPSALSTLIVTAIALLFTVNGRGPFVTGDLYYTVFSLTVFTVYATTAGFVFVSLRREREMTLETVRRSEAFLQETGRMAKVGGWEFDVRSNQANWTEETIRILELDPAHTELSRSMLDYYDPPDRVRLEHALDRAKNLGEPYDLTLGMTTERGNHRWVRVMCNPQWENGHLVKMSGTMQDVTEQYEAARAIRAGETKYRILAENVRDIIWTSDLDMKMTYISPSVLQLRGYTVEEAMKLEAADLGPAGTREKIVEAAQSLVDSASSSFDDTDVNEVLELELYRKDGSSFSAEIVVTVLRDDAGMLSGFLGVTRDISARKAVERSLKESELRLNRTGRISQVGGWEYDVLEDTMYWTEETCHIFDRPTDYQPVLENSLNFCHPDDREILQASIVGALNHGAHIDMEHRVKTHRGTDRWVRSICEPVVVDGKTVRLLGTIQDITDRKRAEAHLRLLESVITHTNDAIIISDPGPIGENGPPPRFVNEAFTRMTGYTYEEVADAGLDLLRGAKTSREDTDRMVGQLRATQSCTSELIIYGKDGREIWVDAHVLPVKSEEGDVTHFVTVVRDITEKKIVEAERLELGARATAVIENAEDAIITIDPQGIVERANGAAETLFSCPGESLAGKGILELVQLPGGIDGPGDVGVEAQIRGLADAREVSGLRYDGVVFPVSLSVGEFFVDDDRFFTFIIHDMTRQAELERQLLQSQKMESLGTLAGGIAHDFNNILQAIMGFSAMARQHISDKDLSGLDDCIEEIDKGAFRAASLVEQILTFSRDSGVAYGPIDLGPIVHDVLTFLRGSLPVTIEIAHELDATACRVWGNANQVHQVLNNLATNAFHAMEDHGGVLRVALECIDLTEPVEAHVGQLEPGGYGHISIADTGAGIPPEIMNQIFDPFFTTKHKGKGTGLGLATVHGIIARMKGGIRLESEVGVGSTVHIYLPLLQAVEGGGEVVVESKASTETATRECGGTVLVVDDEQPIVALMTMMLKKKGFEAIGCVDAAAALEMVKERPSRIDVAIVDYTMPEMTGLEVAAALHGMRPDMPILIATGMMEAEDFTVPDSIGVVQVLRKPVPPADLVRIIDEVILNAAPLEA